MNNNKGLRERIHKSILEGFATSPSRCWTCEARDRKAGRTAEIREANLEHISQLTDEIIEAVREMVEQTEPLKRGNWIMHPDWISRKELLDEIEKQLKV